MPNPFIEQKLIYSEVKGKGKNLVLLHGWGMHGGIWGEFKETLSEDFRIHVIDLPGFGFSKNIENEFTLASMSEAIEVYVEKIKQPVILLGWSLGGLIMFNILKRKNIKLDKVIFISATPSFTKKPDWPDAMEQSVFDDFLTDLQIDYKKTLKRFLSLQTRGSDLARDTLRELSNKLYERDEPNIKALSSGLNILRETDMRNENPDENSYEIPAMLVMGDKDTLVPLQVKFEFEKMFPNLEQLILKKAGHAPFLSSPEICAEKIKNFINE